MNRKLYALLAVLVLSSMVLVACGGAATPAATQAPQATSAPAPTQPPPPTATSAPKILTVALQQEPDNQNALFSSMTYVVYISQMTEIALAKWDGKGDFIPDLASDVPTAANGGVSADGLTITWKLRPGLKWSDGQPLTSKDVAFTEQVLVDPKNAVYTRAGYDQITSVDTPDDQTAVLHFKAPYAAWQTLFTQGQNNNGSLLPMHILQGKTGLEKDPFIHQPTVFSGPFMIKEWVAGDHMSLVPNPNYWQGKPKLDQLNIKFVPDSNTALNALKNGDVDLVPDFAESDIPTVSALEPNQHLRIDTSPYFEHLLFNMSINNSKITDASGKVIGNSDLNGFCPFQDVNVRKAFMLAIDRDTIVKTLLFGKTFAPTSLWPNSSWYNTNLAPYPYDLTQAGQLLDAAGYKVGSDGIRAGTCNGKPVKFSVELETTVKALRQDEQAAIQANLKQIGVDVKTVAIPSGTFFGSYTDGANMATGKFDMAIFTTGFFPDPYTDSFLCTAIPNKDNPGGDNYYHYCDQSGQTETMFKQLATTTDPAARKTVVDAIQKYQYDNVLFIPLYARADVFGFSDRFVFPPTSGYSGWAWDAFDFDVK